MASNTSSAVMHDNGNFVLYNKNGGIVWQSFGHPTDTILGEQSLYGGSELVSSFSNTNYSSGRFRLKMQVDGNLVMYPINTADIGTDAYWDSHTFGNSKNYLYLNRTGSLLLINSTDSDIIGAWPVTEPSYSNYSPIIFRATIGDDGNLRLYSHIFDPHTNLSNSSVVWKALESLCDVKSYCGFNSYCTLDDELPYCVCLPGSDFIDLNLKFRGCERNFTKVRCESGKDNMTYYSMAVRDNLVLEDHPYYKAPMGEAEDCSKSCLEDCDCDAARFRGGECEKHKFPLRYVKRAYGGMSYDFPPSTTFFKIGALTLKGRANESVKGDPVEAPVEKVETTSRKTWLLILVISIGFSIYSCFALSLSGFYAFKYRLLKYKRLLEAGTLGLAEEFILRSYTYKELSKATDGFKQELGKGSFGTVYKGSFCKGQKAIAVKRLEKVVDEGEREFRAEMQAIGRTHHKNLVRLLGYCAEGTTKRLLVYEFMRNGTLADLLFRSERLPDWNERVRIALDVARGILYLHEECETPIIHCDIKPQNILMDDFWTAKISDFGMAKLLMPDQTRTFTMVRGTRGYLAPEWQKNTPISVKVDVFSYGIVLLEIVCCRKNMDVKASKAEQVLLSTWAYNCFERGKLDLLVGYEEVDKGTLERLVTVALWCIQDEPALRPSMKGVVLMLEGITDVAAPPCPTST